MILRMGAVATALAALALLVVPVRAAEWASITPLTYSSAAKLSVDQKEITYYRFDRERPLAFSAQGPTRVKILTRLVIPNDREKDSYTLLVERDGVADRETTFDTVVSTRAFYLALDSVRPGVLRRLTIDVPTGRHAYEIRPEGFARVDARVYESATATPDRVSLAPRDGAAVETLLSGDSVLTYYLLTKNAPVILDVVGPTTIRINTRLLFDQTLSKREPYVLGVREPGAPEVLYKLEATRSETVVCRDRGDVVPGALRYFMLEVGPGRHAYEFRLADTAAKALAIRFHIPRGDLDHEP